MSNILRWIFGLTSALGGFFFSAIVDRIFSRIISHVIEAAYQEQSFTTNLGQPNSDIILLASALEIEHSTNENCSLCFEPNTHTVIARDLGIMHSNNERCWLWIRHWDSRFSEVALLLGVRQLEIVARINLHKLLRETNYTAHLIFKVTPDSEGLDTMQKAIVYMYECEWTKDVCVNLRQSWPLSRCNIFPIIRSDGWLELEVGQFYCDGDMGHELVITFEEIDARNRKSGLIIAGIELRSI